MRTCNLIPSLMLLSVTSYSASALTIGQKLNPAETFLDCNTAPSEVQIACKSIQNQVNQKLSEANLAIENNGIIYKYLDRTAVQITGGCSRNSKITSSDAAIWVKEPETIELSGDVISKPALFAMTLPVEIAGRIGFEDKTGMNTPFSSSCTWLASDSYSATGNLKTTAKILVLFSLEPKYRKSPEGEYVFALKATVDIQASLSDSNFSNLDFHGVNPLFNIYAGLVSVNSNQTRLYENILKGNSVQKSAEDFLGRFGFEWGRLLLLTNDTLGDPIFLNSLTERAINNYVDKKRAGYNDDINSQAAKLKSKINAALGADSEGMIYYVLDQGLQPIPTTITHKDLIKNRRWVGDSYSCKLTFVGGGGAYGSYTKGYLATCGTEKLGISKSTYNNSCTGISTDENHIITGSCDYFTVYKKI